MLRFICWPGIILFLFIPVYCTGALGSSKTVDSSSQEELEKIRLALEETNVIQVKDNLLTVNVEGIPLNKVLMEIANQVPIKFKFALPTLAEKHLVAKFSHLPIVKGLKQLLSDYNYVFNYGQEKPKGEEREIREVIIMSREKPPVDNDSESIVENAKFMWKEKHLKAIPKVQLDENDVEGVKVEAYYKVLVEELEMAHTYISQLHEHIGQLEEKIEQQNEMLKKRLLNKFEEAPKTVQQQ